MADALSLKAFMQHLISSSEEEEGGHKGPEGEEGKRDGEPHEGNARGNKKRDRKHDKKRSDKK